MARLFSWLVTGAMLSYFSYSLGRMLFDAGFDSRVEALEGADWVALGFMAVLPISVFAVWRLSRDRVIRAGEKVLSAFLVLSAVILIIGFKTYDASQKGVSAGLAAAFFATAGWLFTNYVSTKNGIIPYDECFAHYARQLRV